VDAVEDTVVDMVVISQLAKVPSKKASNRLLKAPIASLQLPPAVPAALIKRWPLTVHVTCGTALAFGPLNSAMSAFMSEAVCMHDV